MRTGGYVLVSSLMVNSCAMWPTHGDSHSRPFEVNVMPTTLHVGDRVDVAYRYLGPTDRHYQILFGTGNEPPGAMLELAVPTTDPGTFSFVLAPRMMDRNLATKSFDVKAGQSYGVALVGYKNGELFGYAGASLFVLEASGSLH